MARIRSIKPEFFTSASIVCMSPLSRLFYASLWCEADREGRLKWDERTLKLRYFPADDCDISLMANELLENGLIVIYEVDGKSFAEIPSFLDHQIINNRESESTLPARKPKMPEKTDPPDKEIDAPFTRESVVLGEGKGKEGKGKEGASKRETSIPDNFAISPGVKTWADGHGYDQLETHLENFIDACKAKGYTYRDWDAAFRNAIAKNWANVARVVTPIKPGLSYEEQCAANLAAFDARMRAAR